MTNSNFYSRTELDSLPSYETYESGLRSLMELNFKSKSFEEVGMTIMKHLKLLPALHGYLSEDILSSTKLYRVRQNIGATEELSNPSTYSYPNAKYCKSNGRINASETTVFYASDDPWGAILESKLSTGDFIHLGIWKPKLNRRLKASLCLPKAISPKSTFSILSKEAHEYAEDHAKSASIDKLPHLKLLNEFIPNLINKDIPPYFISSWLGYQILEVNQYDVLLYPSAINGEYSNFAFNPLIADSFLELEKVIKFKVVNADSPSDIKITHGNIGEIIDNRVYYRKHNKGDIDFINSILGNQT